LIDHFSCQTNIFVSSVKPVDFSLSEVLFFKRPFLLIDKKIQVWNVLFLIGFINY